MLFNWYEIGIKIYFLILNNLFIITKMPFKQTIKYMRQMNQIPKDWKNALRLCRIKKDIRYADETVYFKNGNFYYYGLLLQEKTGETNKNARLPACGKLYYKDVVYYIEDY